jgi:serine protease AprX
MVGLRRRFVWVCGVSLFVAACSTSARDEGDPESSSRLVVGFDFAHTAKGPVTDLKTFEVGGVRVVTWKETFDGATQPFYAVNLGTGWNEPKQTSYQVALQARRIDPSTETPSKSLRAGGTALHIVQYATQPLEVYWDAIAAAGGEVHQYLHGNAQLVRADSAAVQRIAKLPFVRAVTPMNTDDKVEPLLTAQQGMSVPVNIVLVDGKLDRARVQDHIKAVGGKVLVSDPENILIEAEIPSAEVNGLAALSQVLWVEVAAPIEEDYETANIAGGANYLRANVTEAALPGYTGVGIRGHIIEGITPTHGDFAANDFRGVPVGVQDSGSDSHGMQTFGIVFGSGAGNAAARGALPNGQGFYTHNRAVMSTPTGSRAALVGKLIAENKVMFQTASWGNGTVKTYAAKSAEMDALILQHDIPITQSQSNTGSQQSRPQAWAKNIISIGGLRHLGTLTMDDDKWNRSGSIGPAADGSIKPDLSAYNDLIVTTTTNGGYSTSFGGTSGATPIVAGHVGLTIELWTNGVFGNPLIAQTDGEDMASYRFKNRPHFTTTKALLIHSAKQYAFDGEAHDRTRVHQGWGFPDLEGMYERRTNMLVVNETDVVKNLDVKKYSFNVPAGAPDFRATLVYADKEAAVPATIHRVNNLDLRVTAPDGTVYWGNNGLKASMFSTPGGTHNVLDTVENVLLKAPQAGTWKVEVIADEINADTHLETREADADYALVVSSGPTS